MRDSVLDDLARRLRRAQFERIPCAPLTSFKPDLTVDDAYTIQETNVSLRVHDRGLHGPAAHPIGFKIGITSEAIQTWLKCTEPDFGTLLDDMVVCDRGIIPAGLLLQPRAEGEIAFVLGEDLRGPGVTPARAMAAINVALPAIEIIDSRIADWKITYPDTIADNASSGLFVLGSTPVPIGGLDLALAGMALRINDRVVSTGAGLACLGHPYNAVAWLANAYGRRGKTLRAGDIILSGALGPAVQIVAGDHLHIAIDGLGEASARVV